MIVTCDKGCGADFELSLIMVKLKEDIEKNYFSCPQCAHEYIAFYTNSSIRKKQKDLFDLEHRYRALKKFNTKKVIRKINDIKKRIKQEIDILKNKLERVNEDVGENKMSPL